MDCSPPGPSVHGIFQARVLEWVAIALSAPTSYSSKKLLRYFFGERFRFTAGDLGQKQEYKLGN